MITYLSTGVLNFAFAAMAYADARFYYYLNTQNGWSTVAAGLVTILVLAPLMGVLLWAIVFRHLRLASSLIRVVTTIGLAVAIPAICAMIFGTKAILTAPGLSPQPVPVYKIGSVSLTLDQVFILAAVALLGAAGFAVMNFTDTGLRVRAMVNSRALMSLSGGNPSTVEVGVWAVGSTLAGLVGVLVAPIVGLDSGQFTLLMVAAFSAVVAGRLRNVAVAVVAALLLGAAYGFVNRYMNPDSPWTGRVIDSLPFGVMFIFLIYYIVTGQADERQHVGGTLDRAIVPATRGTVASTKKRMREDPALSRQIRRAGPIVMIILIALLPLILTGFWVGLVGDGLAFGLLFLSYTLITGEGGMIWLCEISFAGLGAVFAAQLATTDGWPVLPAALVASLIVVPVGMIVGAIATRLGDLYIALVTLSFGFLIDNLVFTQNRFNNFNLGVNIGRPSFATTNRAFTYFVLAAFCVAAVLVWNFRKSTAGMALAAVRWSPPGARTIGINVVRMKVVASGLAAFLAAFGGALLAMYNGAAQTGAYATLAGMVTIAVLVTIGVRSNIAAAVAGLVFVMAPAIFTDYLPTWLANLPAALFGVGAIMVARDPDGVVATYARQLEHLLTIVIGVLLRRRPQQQPQPEPARQEVA
jgi:branched-chain amino acid transport system permease protein